MYRCRLMRCWLGILAVGCTYLQGCRVSSDYLGTDRVRNMTSKLVCVSMLLLTTMQQHTGVIQDLL
jgi:hypothetical protein